MATYAYHSNPAYLGALYSVTNGNVTYLHKDHLGSASTGTIGNGVNAGNIAWNEQYTPFGETILNPAANDNLDGFTGHIKDKATGLNYMQARYYDPALGRFLSIDPVEFSAERPGMFNRYTYTYNDPINFTDPTGMVGGCDSCWTDMYNSGMSAESATIAEAGFRPYSEAFAKGTLIGATMTPIGRGVSVGIGIATRILTKKALTTSQKKAVRSMKKNIKEHKARIKSERKNPTVKPEMVGKTTKKQQKQQRKTRENKHKRDIKDWKKQIKEIKKEAQ
ncbi:MAG: RHS repeat-associated core domain-containing protein [Robiginitomaculum sp.]|nr:RHS repeat-associated core domain-containing protein [Robiginitomaculum sp.]